MLLLHAAATPSRAGSAWEPYLTSPADPAMLKPRAGNQLELPTSTAVVATERRENAWLVEDNSWTVST